MAVTDLPVCPMPVAGRAVYERAARTVEPSER
jgi:hypothetical protein